MGEVAHHAEIVRDEEIGEPSSSWRSRSRFRICAWIETSSAETASSQIEQARLDGERARDADALALAARELVRVAPHLRGIELHARAAAPRRARCARARRRRCRRTACPRRSRRARACADRATPADPGTRSGVARRYGCSARASSRSRSTPSNEHAPGLRLDQAQERAADRRLAAARLADQRERAPGGDREVDVVDRAHLAATARWSRPLRIGNQVRSPSDAQQRFAPSHRPPAR